MVAELHLEVASSLSLPGQMVLLPMCMQGHVELLKTINHLLFAAAPLCALM